MSARLALPVIVFVLPLLLSTASGAEDFRPVRQWPAAAPSAFGVVGTNLDDGRLALWNGDTLYFQDVPGGGRFIAVAEGYEGDPGFVALSPDGNTLLLGAGFSPRMYLVNANAPEDYEPSSEILTPTHYSGVFLDDALVAIDRSTDDFSSSELVVIDISESKSAPHQKVVLRSSHAVPSKANVLDKPEFSFSSNLAVDVDRTVLFVMDANSRELRRFSVAEVIGAFLNQTELDWESDGTLIGNSGDYFTGGVSGITPDGYLVIGGSEGFGQPGGIQIVDPANGSILEVLDPAGTEAFYNVIYNPVLDSVIATTNNFGEPAVTYAEEDSVAPLPTGGSIALLTLSLVIVGVTSRRLLGA